MGNDFRMINCCDKSVKLLILGRIFTKQFAKNTDLGHPCLKNRQKVDVRSGSPSLTTKIHPLGFERSWVNGRSSYPLRKDCCKIKRPRVWVGKISKRAAIASTNSQWWVRLARPQSLLHLANRAHRYQFCRDG